MSEGFGGHREPGPASPWDLSEFRCHQGVNDAARGATFLCRFAAADQKHPVGILTNPRSLQEDLFTGWPIFITTPINFRIRARFRVIVLALDHIGLSLVSVVVFLIRQLLLFFRRTFWVPILRAIDVDSGPVFP